MDHYVFFSYCPFSVKNQPGRPPECEKGPGVLRKVIFGGLRVTCLTWGTLIFEVVFEGFEGLRVVLLCSA